MRALIVLLTAIAGPLAYATPYQATGQVKMLSNVDRPTYGPNMDSVLIEGFSSAGTCATNDGLIGLILRDDEGGRRQYASLLAAKLSGGNVKVRLDDSVKTANGYCYLLILEVS
jgi:hypothetical protein